MNKECVEQLDQLLHMYGAPATHFGAGFVGTRNVQELTPRAYPDYVGDALALLSWFVAELDGQPVGFSVDIPTRGARAIEVR
jgi:hypothetical protein